MVSGALVARLLGVDGRGELALIFVTTLLVSQIGYMGLPQAIAYWGSRNPAGARVMARYLTLRLLWLTAFLVVIQAIAVILVMGHRPSIVRSAAYLSLVALPGIVLQQIVLALLQGQASFNKFNVIRTLPSTAYGGGILALYIVGGGTILDVMIVWASTFVAVALIGLVLAIRELPAVDGSADPDFGAMVSFGIRGFLGATSPIDTFSLDQAIVGLFISARALGLYVAAVAFTNFPRVIAQNIGLITFPRVAAATAVGERDAGLAIMRRYVLVAGILCGSIVVVLELLIGPLVRLVYGSAFDGCTGLARILLFSAWLAGLRRVLADGARGFGLPGVGTAAEVGSWLVLIVVLIPLIALDGVTGVAIALNIAGIAGLAIVVAVFGRALRRGPKKLTGLVGYVSAGAPGEEVPLIIGDQGPSQT